ncbi:hypothetical protein SCA6_020028 [Theobroma cacao]
MFDSKDRLRWTDQKSAIYYFYYYYYYYYTPSNHVFLKRNQQSQPSDIAKLMLSNLLPLNLRACDGSAVPHIAQRKAGMLDKSGMSLGK